ncbi:hypothetical protein ACH4D5_12250 [Streptomyces sp. NPDC018029]|uniref:hypothetical protein n=1 Tax=Streptomyces sp. NPDC018029 TaxID=3365032 RepID=UPI00379AF099
MRASFRVSFTDFIPDPDDADCQRWATAIPPDRITFEDDQLILWIDDTPRAKFPLDVVASVEVAHFPGSSRREDSEQFRTRYPNFGKPWSRADGQKLLALHPEGRDDYEVLAAEFGRQPTAIRSRLAKLGLEHL